MEDTELLCGRTERCKYAFHDDDGGAGRFRGGKGVKLDYRVVSDEAYLTVIFGRRRTPPWGMDGGRGSANRIMVLRKDGRQEEYSSVARLRIGQDEVVRLVTATGGGWGDARERPHEQMLADLEEGFITPEQALRDYGLSRS